MQKVVSLPRRKEMKKILCVLGAAIFASTGLFASFGGHTSADFSYMYNEGGHYLDLASDSLGFASDFPVGYYAGLDAMFNVEDINDWRIGMLAGPAYSYEFGTSGVSFDIAAGLSMSGSPDFFRFGVGAYAGASWRMTEIFGLGLGVRLGSNFVSVSFDSGDVGLDSDFYVSPSVSAIFYY